MGPRTDWKEDIAADEEARFKGYAEIIGKMQTAREAKYGKKGRALHRKQTLGLEATVVINADVPTYARHGVFAKAGEHRALIRLSNGSPELQRDKVADVRGFGLKVLGVEGPGALGFATTSQDFVMINRKAFVMPDPDTFMDVIQAAPKGPLALLGALVKRHGLLRGLKMLAALGKGQGQPFSGFATEPFSTVVPIACGPYAMRVRIVPEARAPISSDDFAKDVAAQLAKGPIHYALQAQFYVSEDRTPIENAAPEWLESDSPHIAIGKVTIPVQSVDGEGQRSAEIESGKFDPWNALVEHRPLGAVMRARKHAYFKSQQGRGVA